MLKLIIGNKTYSSWSLRPWLLLRQFGIPFEERLIPLYQPGSSEEVKAVSPSGKVPCLLDGQRVVWESLAICEYLAECFPEHAMWPRDAAERAEARALAAEMHAGFSQLRQHCPMNLRHRLPPRHQPAGVMADLSRFGEMVEDLRRRFAERGPFLMGEFGIVDAMYAPLATRCRTYALPLPALAQAWADQLLALPAMQEWYAAAKNEPWILSDNEPCPQ